LEALENCSYRWAKARDLPLRSGGQFTSGDFVQGSRPEEIKITGLVEGLLRQTSVERLWRTVINIGVYLRRYSDGWES